MKRIPALDGLRGVAVTLVVVFHAWRGVLPGGAYGVTLFFVLSGFLITKLLVADVDEHGQVRWAAFYWRRALRLLPALFVVCAFVAVAGHADRTVPALAYYANFVAMNPGEMGVMTHSWSLAVEEHFYLLWPLVIAAVPKQRRRQVVGLLLAVAVAWRVRVMLTPASFERIYVGTDTNAVALLAGCWLAVSEARWRVVWMWPVLLVGTAAVFEYETRSFLWFAFPAIVVSVMAVQYARSGPAWLAVSPLVWLGRVSYGIYLWHYVLLRVGWFDPWQALGWTAVAVTASWFLVELPVMRWGRGKEKRIRGRSLRGTRGQLEGSFPSLASRQGRGRASARTSG